MRASVCNAGDPGPIPGLPWSHKELETEQLTLHHFLGGPATPPQATSCLFLHDQGPSTYSNIAWVWVCQKAAAPFLPIHSSLCSYHTKDRPFLPKEDTPAVEMMPSVLKSLPQLLSAPGMRSPRVFGSQSTCPELSAQGLVPLRWGCALPSPNAPGTAPGILQARTLEWVAISFSNA